MTLTLTPVQGTAGSAQEIGSGSLLIGRDPRAQLRIDDPTASGRHAVISGQDGSWQIQDFSRNGTFVNDTKLEARQRLRDGDTIRVAQSQWRVGIADDAGAGAGRATYVRAVTPADVPVEHTVARASQRSTARASAGGGDNRMLGIALEALAELARTRKAARADLLKEKTSGGASPLADARKGQALAVIGSMQPSEAEAAIQRLGREVSAHDAALLAAMQAALHAVLDQFAPSEIQQGGKSDAQAWQAYRQAFEDSDVGFVELFARTLEETYRDKLGD